MYQPMTEVMQVQSLAGHIGAKQHLQRVVKAAKTLYQLLLLGIGHASVQHLRLPRLKMQVGVELPL